MLNEIKEVWKIIEYERVNGYDHRGPKKRIKSNNLISENKCHINIDQFI